MNAFDYALEDDESYDEFAEDDELFAEDDESYDDLAERRRRRRGRGGRIKRPRTGTGKGLFRPRPQTGKYVTQAQLEAGLTRVGNQIKTNAEAIKKVTAQANRVTSDLSAATTRLDKQVGELKKETKKQAETALLLTLLQKAPAVKTESQALTVVDPVDPTKTKDVTVVTKVEQEKTSNLLPLILLAGSGGLGGGDTGNTLLLALAVSGQL